jgi:hypothetical protein
MTHRYVAISFIFCSFVVSSIAQQVIPADPPLRWWKGNTHTHTYWSDGDNFPEMVAEWYREHGYNFLGLSDHNVLSQGQRWVRMSTLEKKSGKIAMDKYLARFGPKWVETRSGENGAQEVRLKPLNEYRSLLEERGKFIMIQAEEITNSFQGRAIHMGAVNLFELIPPPKETGSLSETIDKTAKLVEEQSKKTGQEMFVHVNHPNFRWGVTAEDIASAISEQFFEVYNGHPGVNQRGDELHAPIERVWDIVNALRMKKLNADPVYGLATDDSHNYHYGGASRSISGRGWIMVRARFLTPESLVRAIKTGDFYSSSGVTLRDVKFNAETGELSLEIESDGDATFTTQFVGTPKDVNMTSRPAATTQAVTQLYTDEIGKTFATVEGLRPSYKLTGKELYIRAIVNSNKPPEFPVWDTQVKQAWTQPVGWTPGSK